MTNDEQVLSCAAEQAARDIPYAEVMDCVIYRKIVNEDLKLVAPGGIPTGDRWYVEVGLKHRVDESEAAALYRVWRSAEGLQALKVDIR